MGPPRVTKIFESDRGKTHPVHCTKSNCQVPSINRWDIRIHSTPCILLFPTPLSFLPPPNGTGLRLDSSRHLARCRLRGRHRPLFTERLTPGSRLPMPQDGSAPPPKLEDRFVLSQEIARGELTTRFDRRLIHLLNICPHYSPAKVVRARVWRACEVCRKRKVRAPPSPFVVFSSGTSGLVCSPPPHYCLSRRNTSPTNSCIPHRLSVTDR